MMSFESKHFVQKHQKDFNLVIKSSRYLSQNFLKHDDLLRVRPLNIENIYTEPLLLALFFEFKMSHFCNIHVKICLALSANLDEEELKSLAFEAFINHAIHEYNDHASYNEQALCVWLNNCYSQLIPRNNQSMQNEDRIQFVYEDDYEVHNRHRLTRHKLVPEGVLARKNSFCVIN